eukprot:RCo012893
MVMRRLLFLHGTTARSGGLRVFASTRVPAPEPRRDSRGNSGGGGSSSSNAYRVSLDTVSTDTPHFTFYDKSVEAFASKASTPVTVKEAYEWKAEDVLKNAQWLQRELPIRMAKTVRNFQNLPYIVGENPHINKVYTTFLDALQSLGSFPPITTLEHEKRFTQLLRKHFEEAQSTIELLGWGIKEVRELPLSVGIDYEYLDSFINDFLAERLSRRILAEQHIALHEPRKHWNGIFHSKCKPHRIVKQTLEEARELCEEQYGLAPPYIIDGDTEVEFAYVPSHLQYILLELLKNSARATMDRHMGLKQTGASSTPESSKPKAEAAPAPRSSYQKPEKPGAVSAAGRKFQKPSTAAAASGEGSHRQRQANR